METSGDLSLIYAALSAFQSALKPAIKHQDNPYFGSKYADLSEIWDVIRGPLSDNGLCIIQILDGKDIVTRIGHTSGQFIEGRITIPMGDKTGPQAYGSAVTYMRRYALSAILGVVGELDDDGEIAEGRAYLPSQRLIDWVDRLIYKAKEDNSSESAMTLIHERLKGQDLSWAKGKILSSILGFGESAYSSKPIVALKPKPKLGEESHD